MHESERTRLKEAIARNVDGQLDGQIWRPDLTAVRKPIEALLSRQAGFADAEREFDAITSEGLAKVEALAAGRHEAAMAASRERATRRDAMAANRIRSFQAVVGQTDLNPDAPRFLLQDPFDISLTGAAMSDHSIVTGGSFVRFGFEFDKDSDGAVGGYFSYVWQNPTGNYALINTHGYVIFDGYLKAGTGSGFWPGSRRAKISAEAYMSLHDWGQEPVFPTVTTASHYAAILDESDGGFADAGSIVDLDLLRGLDIDHSLYIVKPHGTVGLVVGFRLPYSTGNDGGYVKADFAGGDYRVVSPGVLLQVVSWSAVP